MTAPPFNDPVAGRRLGRRLRRLGGVQLTLSFVLSVSISTQAEPAAKEEHRGPSDEASTVALQEASDSQTAEGDPVEIVVTGTRTREQAERATLQTGVVTREEAERRGATNVGEALSGEPGLQVNPNAYAHLGSPSGVQIQGLDAERVLVLRDGERIIGDAGGVIDLAAFPLSDVDRIEYVSGPTSSLYGTGALGGVVNIVSGPPRHEGFSMRGRLERRSVPSVLLDTSQSLRSDSWWTTLSSSSAKSEGVRLIADRPDLALAAKENGGVDLRMGHEGLLVDSLIALGWHHERAQGLVTEELPALGSFRIELPETTTRTSIRNVERLHLGEGSQLQSSLSAQWFQNQAQRDRVDSPLDERRFRDHDHQSGELSATLADGARTWVVGVRGEREAFEQRLERTSSSQGELQEAAQVEVAPVELRSVAAYGQLAWKFGESLTVLPGLRAELHDRFGYVVAPRFAMAFFPTEQWRVRASLGTGFRAPSAKEFGFFFDHSSLGYRVIGNEELRPERSLGVNGDVTFRPNPLVGVRAGAFQNWVSDLISTEFVGQEQLGVDDYRYVNVGRARTAGFEVSSWWSVSPWLRTDLGYSYLFTQNDDSNEPLPSRPPHTLVTSLTVMPLPEFEFTFRQRTVSRAFVTADTTSPAFATVDLRLATTIDWLTNYVGLLNAFDQKHDPARPGDQRPVLGRVFVVGASAIWPSENE